MIDDDDLTAEQLFGTAQPGEAVRATELQAADRREGEQRARLSRVCEGCGRLYLRALLDRDARVTRWVDGAWWHPLCYSRRTT